MIFSTSHSLEEICAGSFPLESLHHAVADVSQVQTTSVRLSPSKPECWLGVAELCDSLVTRLKSSWYYHICLSPLCPHSKGLRLCRGPILPRSWFWTL